MEPEGLVFAFHEDTLYCFDRANEHSATRFGGPLEAAVSGLPTGTHRLHMVVDLDLSRIPRLRTRPRSIPLIYGFIYDGCEMQYRITPTGRIQILDMFPSEPSDDFPYANYPSLLPYVPLKVVETRSCSFREFADLIPNMVEEQPSELVVAVPPPATLGMSLWGPMGDGSDVTLVFECDLSDETVRAYTRFIT